MQTALLYLGEQTEKATLAKELTTNPPPIKSSGRPKSTSKGVFPSCRTRKPETPTKNQTNERTNPRIIPHPAVAR